MKDGATQTDISRKVVLTMVNAAKDGNVELLLSCYADDLVVYEPSFLPYGGQYRGMKEFMGLWSELVKYMDPLSIKLGPMVADGDRVVCHWTVKTTSHDSECNMCESYVVRDEKITEIRIYFNELGSIISKIKR
jgi:hypothetical protein